MGVRIVEKNKPPSTSEDVLRSIQTGAVEGGAQLLGTVGDLFQAGRDAAQGLATFAAKHGAGDGRLPKGPLNLASLPGVVATAAARQAGVDPRLAKLAAAVTGPEGVRQAPTSKDILGAVTQDRPQYQPQTRAGKYARSVAQFAPAALAPGSAAQRIANVVAPAVTSEAGGQITEGTALEPYARVLGAVVGGVGANLATQPGPRTRILAEASRGASDAQIGEARQLMEAAERQGVRLTLAEAVQQVTDGATGMGRMQRVLEGTRAGNERIGPVMAERPAQVRQAITNFGDQIAPPTADPYTAGRVAQESAGEVLTGVRQQINANARPFYDALANERMPTASPAYAELVQNPAYQEALTAVRSNPVLNAEIAQLPDDSLAVVNEVVKQLDTLAENARPNPAASTGSAQLSAAYEAASRAADELASATSEPWRLSRAMVASGREAFLEPLQAGPMGAISRTGDIQAQTRALFPSAPPEGAAAATGMTLEMLPADVGAQLTRQHIMNTANEATQDLQAGPNPWGGAKWAAQQMGNPEQAAVLETGVQAVGGDMEELRSLVESLRATGKRQPPGSMTAYNARDLEELGKAGVLGEVARTGLNPPGFFRRIGQGFQDWQTENNAGRLADAILADPAQAEAILLHARQVVPPGQGLETIERLALQAQLSRQQQPPASPPLLTSGQP